MRKIFLGVLISIIMVGCKDEELVTDLERSTTLEVSLAKKESKNVLYFQNFKELEKRIHEIIEDNTDLMKQSIAEFKEKGRMSLLMAYNLTDEDVKEYGIKKDNIAKVSSQDQTLLYLLNSEGEVVIEDTTYRIDGDFVYALKEANSDYIYKFLSEYKEGTLKIEEKKLFKYTSGLHIFKHGNKEEKKDYEIAQRTEYGSFPNDGSVRVKARQYQEYWFFYSSVGALTKTEQYWNSWVNVETTNRLKFSMYFERYSIFDEHTPLEGVYRNDDIIKRTYAIDKVFGVSVGSPAPFTFKAKRGLTQHQAGWYGNNSHTVNLYY